MIYHDVIVVGSGLAGQRAALEAISHDIDVAIISKLKPMNSHSVLAQGGINIAIDDLDRTNYFEDTVKGSDYLADQDSVEILVNDSKIQIEFIENIENNTVHSIKPIKPSNVKTPIFIPWLMGASGLP